MRPEQEHVVTKLLSGHYLRHWMLGKRKKCYRLYDEKNQPLANIRLAVVDKLDRYVDPKIKLWKRSKDGKITLNLRSVRRLHGRSKIKTLYKKRAHLDEVQPF